MELLWIDARKCSHVYIHMPTLWCVFNCCISDLTTGAIKFGDALTREECGDLLQSLSLCDLPFQCAHGRPSVMPLIATDKLTNKYVSHHLDLDLFSCENWFKAVWSSVCLGLITLRSRILFCLYHRIDSVLI